MRIDEGDAHHHQQEQAGVPRPRLSTTSRTPRTSFTAPSTYKKEFTAALLSSATSTAIADPQYDLTRNELWAYYIYYIGNSGLGVFNFAPTQYQNLLTIRANNLAPLDASGNQLCGGIGQDVCKLLWAGQMRSPTSIVLLVNGISFVIQAVLFVLLGSMADYGTFRPYILIVSSALGIAVSFAWLGATSPSKWDPTGTTLYIMGLVSYQLSLSFWAAAFPGMARCSREVREEERKLKAGESSPEQLEKTDQLMRNRISNISFAVSSLGELVLLAIIQGILIGIRADADQESNTRALSIIIAFSGGAWTLTALPWFLLEKHRPGQPLPRGTNYITAGAMQAWTTIKVIWELKQSLIYLIVYFFLSDALVTTTTVISTITNDLVSFSTTQLNLQLILGIAAQGIGIYGFWLVQKRFKLSTLTLFNLIVPGIILLQIWGLIGAIGHQDRFGFQRVWEAYAYQAFYGLFVCPWYAVSFTMISEFSPKGYEFLFFSLFSLVGKTSAFMGPFISSAIASRVNNPRMPFAFLLALTVASCSGLFFLDLRKAKLQQQVFLQKGNAIKGLRAADTALVADGTLAAAPSSWTARQTHSAEVDLKRGLEE
ncbi:hypothetical protein K437DRAFT_245262 [Tilletiaria anomala UBC 951]|uniref:Autophagy-related protein n=1 Tax=Tilletiaria anomala (strain ATCC 24038 / CBS 436.72 / UBC 951) TaxID=1037660 RepID=A0A066W633_TILAU|nr:uncharacterized protein K437DRAFT_245262 [Tilletiaria anomala UBC 951]KDN49206.1 hypothetical protein K437DRAFT_245262 [Tilletiaria anomala UBC 951]